LLSVLRFKLPVEFRLYFIVEYWSFIAGEGILVYGRLARHILSPLFDLLEGPEVPGYIKGLGESQWWPPARILELQNRKLRKLLKYAYENVPYYRRVFDERGLRPEAVKDSSDLAKLPILTKEIIRGNSGELMARGFPINRTWLTHTGGSTGEPLEFYSTRDQLRWAFATFRRAEKWWGYSLGDRRVAISIRRPLTSKLHRLAQLVGRVIIFPVDEMSTDRLAVFLEKLEAVRPEFITGYPSAIHLLAHFIESNGKLGPRPRAIVTGGEQLYDYQRELFARVFGCPTYNSYGSYEMNQMAQECSEHAGFHIAAESVVMEIVGDDGVPLPAGKEGRVVTTNLHNYAMPFIRYDIGDLGVLSQKVCACGRGLPVLERLSGRTTDFIVAGNGRKISGIALPWDFLGGSKLIEQFQIVQEKQGEVIVRVIPQRGCNSDCCEKVAGRIKARYADILGEDTDIRVEFVERIPVTRDGKRRIVVSSLGGA